MRVGHDQEQPAVADLAALPVSIAGAIGRMPRRGKLLHPARGQNQPAFPQRHRRTLRQRTGPPGPRGDPLVPGVAVVHAFEQERRDAVAVDFAEKALGREPVHVSDRQRELMARDAWTS